MENQPNKQQQQQQLNSNFDKDKQSDGSVKQVPIIVVIHGQSFDFGSGNSFNALRFFQQQQQQQPYQFQLPNEIIVITLNYRLNLLGKLIIIYNRNGYV